MPLPQGYELVDTDSLAKKLPEGYQLVGPVQKMNKTEIASQKAVLAADPRFKPEEPSWLERNAGIMYNMVEPYTAHGILSQPARIMGYADPDTLASPIPAPAPETPGPTGPPQPGMNIGPGMPGVFVGLPGYTDDMGLLPQNKGGTVGEAFPEVFSAIKGVGRGIQQIGHDTVNMENLALLPAFAESKLAQAAKYLIGLTMSHNAAEKIATLPERAREAGANPNASIGDALKLVTETSGETAMPFMVGAQHGPKSAGLRPEDYNASAPTYADFMKLAQQENPLGPERQLINKSFQMPEPTKAADPNWQVSVQAAQKMSDGREVPGYVQIDDVSQGNKWSAGPEKLREQGYDIPDLSGLPQGKYTLAEAIAKTREPRIDLPPTDIQRPPMDVRQQLKMPAGYEQVKAPINIEAVVRPERERVAPPEEYPPSKVKEGGALETAADLTAKPGSSLYSGVPIPSKDALKGLLGIVPQMKEREKELRGDLQLSIPKMMMTEGKEGSGFTDINRPVDGTQLWNRARNKHASEAALLEEMGVADEIKGKRISPAEAAKIVQEQGPRVETKRLGSVELSPERQEYNLIQHEVIDRLGLTPTFRGHNEFAGWKDRRGDIVGISGFRPEDTARLKRWEELRPKLQNEQIEMGSGARYAMVAPKIEQDMPGYTELVIRKPSQQMTYKQWSEKAGLTPEEMASPKRRQAYDDAIKGGVAFEGEKFGKQHGYPANTLAFARGYMDTVNGKKVFHLIEVQSDWMNKVKEIQNVADRSYYTGDDVATREAQRRTVMEREGKNLQDPLLKHYERLAIKAAIEHARKEGAEGIVIQDSKSAMMMEGHDLAAVEKFLQDTEKYDQGYGSVPDDIADSIKEGKVEIPQQKGMELHYDKTLPGIAKELTGNEGQPVSLGEHKMSREEHGGQVFMNEDGTPKTDVSGRYFPLEKTKQNFSLTGRDAPGGKSGYVYSGVPLPPQIKKVFAKVFTAATWGDALKEAKELVPRMMDSVYGHGVDRAMSEGISHIRSKFVGETLPHHVAANPELANRLAEFAAAKTTQAIYGASAGRKLGVDYEKNALKAALNEGIRSGEYVATNPSLGAPMIGGTEGVRINGIRFNYRAGPAGSNAIFARADLAPELQQAINGTGYIAKEGFQHVLTLLTQIQLRSLSDFVGHTSNMYSSIVKDPGKSGNFLIDQALRVPLVKHADAAIRVGYELFQSYSKDPAVQAAIQDHLAKISKIGALRAIEQGPGYSTGKIIQAIDRAGRIARDKMFDNLVEQKLTEDTPLNRREFINKMGQYNTKLMSKEMATARNLTSPFVVAGRTFNKNAIQGALLVNAVKAKNPMAYAQMKISNLLSTYAGNIAVVVVANSVINGLPWGRPGTPVGKIDTGKNDKDGRPITVDPFKLDLTRRGLRGTGIEAGIEGVRKGDNAKDIGTRMLWNMMEFNMHPWIGPPVKPFVEASKEYAATRSPEKALEKGAAQLNPLATAMFGKDEKGEREGVVDYSIRTVGQAAGVGPGRYLSHQEKLEKQAGKPVDSMGLEERIKAEKELKGSQPAFSMETRKKAAQREIDAEFKDAQEIIDKMPKGTLGWLESRGLSVPGYKDSFHLAGVDISLTDKEDARFKELVQQEYTKAIDGLKKDTDMNDVGFVNLPSETMKLAFNRVMIAAKKRARAQLIGEIQKTHPEE